MSNFEFRINLIGAGGVGKTSYATRLITGKFEKKYVATLGVYVHHLTVSTNHGNISFNIWDSAGKQEFQGLRGGYFLGSEGAIFMFDITNPFSHYSLEGWHKDYLVSTYNKKLPVIVCGNKIDIGYNRMEPDEITFPNQINKPYFEISVKDNINLHEPLLYLTKQLTGFDDLEFTES